MLMPGAELGNGVIVAARAVVRGKIPDYAVVSGNPAKVIRMRFDAAEIVALLGIAWWNWSADKIVENLSLIEAGDVAALQGHSKA